MSAPDGVTVRKKQVFSRRPNVFGDRLQQTADCPTLPTQPCLSSELKMITDRHQYQKKKT